MKIARRLHGRFFQQSLTCIMACWVFLNMPLSVAQATPTAAEVVAGSAAVVQADNTTNVQVVSNRAVINWDSLDTSYNETLNFLKESNFAVLNRVVNGGATRFEGSLFAENGSVFIVNTQGLVFGPAAYIQASQFVGSSLDITNTDFMNGQYAFVGGNGAVVNQGDITAQSVALIGKQVLNSGTITSPEGYVVMAAGDRVLLGKRGESIFVELDSAGVLEPMDTQISDVPADVTNEGLINAEGGTIVLAAGDSFSRAVANIGTLATAAGKIKVDAARVENMGTINADAVEGDGGSISLTATEEVILGAGSLTSANAGANGDGGEIIAYSPRNALFHEGARVEAKGGSESGNGGFFELSGLEYVDVRGDIDLTSSSGQAGTFLIDPHNIKIDDSKIEEGDIDDGTWKAYGSSSGYSHLDIYVLEGYLDNGNVTISTDNIGTNHQCHSYQEGWVLFDAGRDLQDGTSGGSGNSLNVYAHDDIRLKSGINFSGDGSVYLNAGDDILLGWDGSDAGILLEGNGNLTMIAKSGDEIIVGGSGITLNGNGNATLRANNHINVNADISTGGELKLFADDNHDYGGDMHSTASLYAGGNMEIRGNDVVLGGPVDAGGNLTITGRDCHPPEWGNVWAQSTLDAGGDIVMSVNGEQYSNYYPGTITLEGDVTAGGDIKLYNNTYTTNLTGNGVKLQAGHDVFLLNDGLGDTESENCTFLQGEDKLAIIAGAGDGVVNGQIHADLTEISVVGSSLTLEQDLDLDTANYLLGNQNNTHLTLISNEGSVTSTTGANAANQWKSIGAHAEENITLAKSGSPETIKLGNSGTPGRSLWAENGYIDIDGFNVKNSPINPTDSLEAGTTLEIDVVHGIDLGGDVTSGSDMRLHADTDTRWGHDVVVGAHINAGGTLDIEGTNVDIQSAHSDGDMSLYAHGLYAAGSPPEPLVGSGDVYVRGELNSGGKIELMATEFGPGGATTGLGFEGGTVTYSADGTIYLYDDVTAAGDLYMYNNTIVKAAGKTLKSTGDDVILAQDKTLVSEYDLTIEADEDIKLGMDTSGGNQQGWIGSGGDVTTEGDLILRAVEDIYAHGNLISNNGSIEIYSSDLTAYLGGNVTAAENVLLNNNTKLNGSGDQTVEAGGTLTANGYVRKCTSGDMWLLAWGIDEGGKSIDLLYSNDGPGTSTYHGNLWVLGNGDVQISDDVTTFGPGCSTPSGTPCSGWETGGVAIVSQEGRIYTTGDADDTLNVSVTGNSDHELGLGIYNSSVEEDARAAIAIVSPEELKIGDGAKLEAFGRYYNDVDDRSAIAFLDTPDTEIPVGGLFAVRNEGDLFDLAIYVASLDSDVTVTAATSILSREPIEPEIPPLLGDDINGEREYECVPKGAMVIDAKTNVNLGGEFVTSLESEAVGGRAEVGDRLELVSRDTEWLDDAIGRLPFASDFTLPDGYAYILRGAGLENLDIDDGRAWVLENMPAENAPLGQRLITTIQGCPALMKWAAEELGIDERRIYIWAEIALAFDMDIQPCDACARLKDTATILGDAEGTYIAALAMAVNQFASVNKPLSEEQMASIAEAISRPVGDDKYYATAGQWLDALGVYVEVLSTDFGWSLDEAVVLVTNKYVAPAIEGSDVNLAAFIAMRLASLGG